MSFGLAALFSLFFSQHTLPDCHDSTLVVNTTTGTQTFHVEIQNTPETRAVGMMGREQMADNEAMLFAFPTTEPVAFWMKNTLIPLDMIFVDENGTITGVHENAQPHDETSIFSPGPVRHVIEIPGGQSTKQNINTGDVVAHPFVDHPDICVAK